ncbi:MAG: hypothetical protein ACYCW6_00415 [Candidatus Xenobia bacterium]
MPAKNPTLTLLYKIFKSRLKNDDLQKAMDKAVKLGLVGLPESTARLREVLLAGSPRVPSTEEIIVELDVREPWWEKLAELQAVVVLVEEELVRISLFEAVKKKVPPVLPYLLLGHGEFAPSTRMDAHDMQRELDLNSIYWVERLSVADLEPLSLLWMEELEEVWQADPAPRDGAKGGQIGLALGRRLAFFRYAAVCHLISHTARANSGLALASAVPANWPIVGPIAGMVAGTGELVLMTSNQLKLCLQVAGLHGLEMNFWDRMTELWPIVGGGFGWRQLSRTAVGFLPGAGPVIKAVVAYTGTYAGGEAARWYYEKGRRLTAAEHREMLGRARLEALEYARRLLERFKGRPARLPGPPALPAGTDPPEPPARPPEDPKGSRHEPPV